MRPRPSVEMGMRISSPTLASLLWSSASSTLHWASGSSTSSTTCLTIQASNLPLSGLKWARTGSLMRCCFLAAEAIASSIAVTHFVSSISFSRATRRRSSPSWTSEVCVRGMFVSSCVPAFLDLDLELGLEHLRQRDHLRLTLLARHRDPAAAGGVEAGEPRHHRLLALAGRLDGDAGEAAGEAAVVFGAVERPVEARRAHLEGVARRSEVDDVEEGRGLARDVGAVFVTDGRLAVEHQPQHAALELDAHELATDALGDRLE